jgi:release factor glutamine methyltransferase
MAITYNNLNLDIRQIFKNAGMENATLEARELVCFASGKNRSELLRDGHLYVSAPVEKEIRALVDRHLAGEPVAYLIGEWEFYGLPLDISESVLIPRADTETLVDCALAKLDSDSRRVLDLCAGSGCVGLAIASQREHAHLLLGEISDGALRICRQNIRRNGLTGRVTALMVDALKKPERSLGEFDVIVSNPPYIPTGDLAGLDVSVRAYEPHLALDGGADGLDFYRAICSQWREAMTDGGYLLFEVGIGEAEQVQRIMLQNGFGDPEVTPDPNGILRVVCGKKCREI